MPGHNPRSRQDRYRRVHQYVSQLGGASSHQLRQALLVLRNAADQLPTPELQDAARKSFTDEEFLTATKELLCIWIHLEAVDQGAEAMPGWLMNFLKLSLSATDYLIQRPQAMEVMQAHVHCVELSQLYAEVSLALASYLGFGACTQALAPTFLPLLANSRAVRQQLLKEALTLEIEDEDSMEISAADDAKS